MYLISACLVGAPCRYNGIPKPVPKLVELLNAGKVVPVCPEQLGGLSTPRPPAERQGDLIVNKLGTDVTYEYNLGAKRTLDICKALNIKTAILKANSPSCGCGKIYDGTFSKKLIDGSGVTAQLLVDNGIKVYNEDNFEL